MRRFFVLFFLLLLIVLVRLTTLKAVYVGNEVYPFDTDPYYRLREMQLVARSFPGTPPPDTYSLGVEQGEDPTFERQEPWLHPSMYVMAWALAGFSNDDVALRKAAMLVPVVWALLTAVLAYVVTLFLADGFAACMAALFAGLSLPLLWRTSLGALDNHMTEGAIFLFIILVPVLFTELPDSLGKKRLLATVLGILTGACALTSYWTVLAVGLMCVSYSVGLALFARGEDKETNAPLYTRVSLLATVFVIAGGWNVAFSNVFAGVLIGVCGLYLLAQVLVWRRFPRARAAVWGVVILAGVAVVWITAPDLAARLVSTFRVVFHLSANPGITELLYSTIKETGGIPLSQLHARFSVLAWISPILVIVLLWQAYKERDFTKLAVCVFFVSLLIPSLWNRRFSHMGAAAMAPLAGWGLWGIAGLCASPMSKILKPSRAAWISRAIITVLVIVGFWPIVQWNAQVRLTQPSVTTPLKEAFHWMKANLPDSENLWTPTGPPPYRVMAAWEIGWWILDLAQCAPVANPAGEGMLAEMNFFFQATPEEAGDVLKKQNARYVLATLPGGKASKAFRVLGLLPDAVTRNPKENEQVINDKYLTTIHAGLYLYDGVSRAVSETQYPPLRGFRLLFESPSTSETPFGPYPGAKLFEVVPGATIVGHTKPGAAATVRLDLETNAGRKFSYTDTCTADGEGNVTFVLPYASDAPNGQTKPLGKWVLESEGQTTPFDITTEAVLEGKKPEDKTPAQQ